LIIEVKDQARARSATLSNYLVFFFALFYEKEVWKGSQEMFDVFICDGGGVRGIYVER
jgi:hypothetical protein